MEERRGMVAPFETQFRALFLHRTDRSEVSSVRNVDWVPTYPVDLGRPSWLNRIPHVRAEYKTPADREATVFTLKGCVRQQVTPQIAYAKVRELLIGTRELDE